MKEKRRMLIGRGLVQNLLLRIKKSEEKL